MVCGSATRLQSWPFAVRPFRAAPPASMARSAVLLCLLAACAVARGATEQGSCSASGEPCALKLNQSVYMQETSWYEYARRVKAGVTVIIPVGATEQVRIAPATPHLTPVLTRKRMRPSHTSTARTCLWAWTPTSPPAWRSAWRSAWAR